ncbi:MAG TPA: phosphoadenosine phosphosulfate reductase family protein [Actinomycetota bacterium]|nr:phosphoadenosine phosphosulfate reductase family protein [Actinomycetota bacterium]
MTPAEAILEKRRTRALPVVTAPGAGDAPELPDFEGAPAEEILRWAFDEFGLEVVLASSMQDSVLIDLAWKVEPRVEVFFLDTGFHFYETLATAKAVRQRYNLNLVMLDPVDDPAVWSEEGYKACCAARKVAPMNNYLKDKKAWMSGLRRAESETRAHAKAVEWDAARRRPDIQAFLSFR